MALTLSDLQSRGLDLSRVRTCVVVAEERPRTALTQSFSKLFKDLGLHPRAVSTSFGCRVNLAICLQVGSAGVGPVLSRSCGFMKRELGFFAELGLWEVLKRSSSLVPVSDLHPGAPGSESDRLVLKAPDRCVRADVKCFWSEALIWMKLHHLDVCQMNGDAGERQRIRTAAPGSPGLSGSSTVLTESSAPKLKNLR